MTNKHPILVVFGSIVAMAMSISVTAQDTFIAEKGDAAAWSHIRVTLRGVRDFKTEDQRGWRNNGTGFQAVSSADRVIIKIDVTGKGGVSYYDYTGSVTVKTTTNMVLLSEQFVISKDGGSNSFSTSWDPVNNPGNLTVVANISGGNPESFIYYVSGNIGKGEVTTSAVQSTPVTQKEKPAAANRIYKDVALITNVEGKVSATLGKDSWPIDLGETLSAGTVVECGPGGAVSVLHIKLQIEYTSDCPGRMIIGEDGVTGNIRKFERSNVQLPENLSLSPHQMSDGVGGTMSLPESHYQDNLRNQILIDMKQNMEKQSIYHYSNWVNFSVDEDTSTWIISNGRIGLLEITRSGSACSARMNVQGAGWENLDNVRISSDSIEFDRTSESQHYIGIYSQGAISGIFRMKGGRTAPWEAIASNSDAKAGGQPPDPTAGRIAGNRNNQFDGADPMPAFTLDFETGDLTGWTKTGTAFDHQPTFGDNPTARERGQPSRHQGNYWIGTFEKYQKKPGQRAGDVQGDGPVGTLTSAPFTVSTSRLTFLVGGGSSDATRVELVVGGIPVLKASGKDHESLAPVSWDLTPYRGNEARIRIVDESSGGWGHINADHFRFEN